MVSKTEMRFKFQQKKKESEQGVAKMLQAATSMINIVEVGAKVAERFVEVQTRRASETIHFEEGQKF